MGDPIKAVDGAGKRRHWAAIGGGILALRHLESAHPDSLLVTGATPCA